jgi:hypothetical protein
MKFLGIVAAKSFGFFWEFVQILRHACHIFLCVCCDKKLNHLPKSFDSNAMPSIFACFHMLHWESAAYML